MIRQLSLLLLAFYLVFTGCAGSKSTSAANGSLPATALKPYGRYLVRNQHLELISSAAHIGFSFEGKECRITASLPGTQHHNYLQYELDGVYQKRIRVDAANNKPIVITAPTEGKHTVWLYKATEAHTGPVAIENIQGKKVQPLQKKKAPLIEFIGNSITCGAAADPSEVPCGTGVYHDQHNAYMAYGPRVARALNIDFVLSSVSGIGVYRNWNSNGPAMPQVYEKTDFQDNNGELWNFSTFTPRVVSIALGTNDLSRGDGKRERQPFDSTAFVNNYIRFVQLVKTKYPNVQIALLSSPMANGSNRLLLQNCLTAVKAQVDAAQPAGAKPVSLFFFEPMQARGCTGHPNVEDHAVLADQLMPFFKELLK